MSYNKSENKGIKRSDTPTPHGICDFLYNIISDKYNPQIVLDPAAGDKRLTHNFKCKTINYEIKEGTDFLKETNPIQCDMVILNPPFNIGTGKRLSCEVFMDKILELCPPHIPIFMICPMGFRLNQKKTSKRWIKMRDHYPAITTIISLPLDIFENTLFHSEIIGFNCESLKPHYFVPENYLYE